MTDLAVALAVTACLGLALAALVYGAWAIAVDDWTPHLRGGGTAEHGHEHEREHDDAPEVDRRDAGDEQEGSPLGLDDSGHGRTADGGREDGLGVGGRHAEHDKSQNGNDRGTGEGNASLPDLEPHEHRERPEPALPEEDGLGG